MTWHEVDVSGWRRVWAVDQNEGFITEWRCEPPPAGTLFTVTSEEWHKTTVRNDPRGFTVTLKMPDGREIPVDRDPEDMPVRCIYAWEPGTGKGRTG